MAGEGQNFLEDVSMLGSTRKTLLLTVGYIGSGYGG